MQYRVILPSAIPPGQKLPVVYSVAWRRRRISRLVELFRCRAFCRGWPASGDAGGANSYYTNAVDPPQDRYEDYIVNDLISDVESRFPVATGRSNRAIVGISMGGFGAVKLALRHPELFIFAGGMSSAIDVPRRAFSMRRLQQSRHYSSIFGSAGSQTRRDNDPFVLVRTSNPEAAPYFFLTCGEQEGLLPANREFAALLKARHFQFEFHTVPGGHDWNQWNAWLPDHVPQPRTAYESQELIRTREAACLGAASQAESASKLVIWCLPAASAIPAGASRTSLSRKHVFLEVMRPKFMGEVWPKRFRSAITPGSGRRMNDSKVRDGSTSQHRSGINFGDDHGGSYSRPRPTRIGATTSGAAAVVPTALDSTAAREPAVQQQSGHCG